VKTLLVLALFGLNTLLMPLLVEVIKERSPDLSAAMVRLAVRVLPRSQRDRYSEEWQAELDVRGGRNVTKLFIAGRVLLVAPTMRRILVRKDKRRTAGERLATAGSYDAFLSYSARVDQNLAAQLQKELHRFGKPWYRARELRVFRDFTSTTASSNLADEIVLAMGKTRYFILLASPEAAASRWVNREVQWWLKNRSPDKILIAITGGDIVWAGTDFDWARTTALPPALQGVYSHEPRWVSLRQDGMLGTDQVAQLAATLHAKPLDEVYGKTVVRRSSQRLMRRAVVPLLLAQTAVIAVLAVLLVRA
jgi:hypothetical protein